MPGLTSARTGLSCLLLATLLVGCGTQGGRQPAGAGWTQHRESLRQLAYWQAEGKLALRTSAQSESASLVWVQRQRSTDLRLSGPMGLNTTTIHSDGLRLELQRGDERRSWDISSPGALAEYTGWDLPLQALPHWLKGLPDPAAAVENLELCDDRLQRFSQYGWQVEYQDYRQFDSLTLPTRLLIQRGDTRARVLIRNWTVLPG